MELLDKRTINTREDTLPFIQKALFDTKILANAANIISFVPHKIMGEMILPFQHSINSRIIHRETGTYSVNYTSTGIGGIVDGLAGTASQDILYWAFYNPLSINPFIGIGATNKPRVAGATMSSGGGLGSTGTLTVTAGHGNRFTVGARVLMRTGVTAGSTYNQGVVTAVSSTNINVTLDATYGLTTNNNASLVGVGSLEVIQQDNFKPYLFSTTEHALYPGGGVEYMYCYLGSTTFQSGSPVFWFRERGDYYPFSSTPTPINALVTTAAVSNTSTGLALWVPENTRLTNINVYAQRTAGTGTGNSISTRVSGSININLLSPPDTDVLQREIYIMAVRAATMSIQLTVNAVAATSVTASLVLLGYWEPNF